MAVVIGVVVALGAAHADDRAAAREHFQKGTKAFDLGAYEEAIAEYSALIERRTIPRCCTT